MNLIAILIPAILTLAIIAFLKMRNKQQAQKKAEVQEEPLSEKELLALANMKYMRSIGYPTAE